MRINSSYQIDDAVGEFAGGEQDQRVCKGMSMTSSFVRSQSIGPPTRESAFAC